MKDGRWTDIRHELVENGGEFNKTIEEQTLHTFMDYHATIKGLVNGHEIKDFGTLCDVHHFMQCVTFATRDALEWVEHLGIGPFSDFEIVVEVEAFEVTRKVVRRHEGEDRYNRHPTGFIYADRSWNKTISRDVVWSSKDMHEQK